MRTGRRPTLPEVSTGTAYYSVFRTGVAQSHVRRPVAFALLIPIPMYIGIGTVAQVTRAQGAWERAKSLRAADAGEGTGTTWAAIF